MHCVAAIIKCYYLEIRKLSADLLSKVLMFVLPNLEKQLYNNIFIPGQPNTLNKEEILDVLNSIREILIYQHNGLFLSLVDNLINKVDVFGLHFASLDIRQESSIHKKVFEAMVASNANFPAELSKIK